MSGSLINFREILLPDVLKGKEIINIHVTPLTIVGKNFGSVLFEVNIQLTNIQTKKLEILQVIAKMVVNNDYLLTIFQPRIMFEKELELYKTIIPELHKFQIENGVEEFIKDLVPKYYGGRLGLENEKYDSDTVLILENLKVQEYLMLEQTDGFDLDTANLILQKLAKLHATSLALKIKKPNEFNTNIKQYLKRIRLPYDELKKVNNMLQIIAGDPVCAKFHTRVELIIRKILQNPRTEPKNDLFATLCHGDFWVNNILVKFEDGIPKEIKFIDFQLMSYDSLGRDLIFFLYTSIKNEIVISNCDELLSNYHKTFVETLKLYKVNSTPFTLDMIEEEMREALHRKTLLQCLLMIFPMFSTKEPGLQIENIRELFDEPSPSDKFLDKLRTMITEFSKKNWI